MRQRLARAGLLLGATFAIGTIGYRAIEGAGWWDSLYMTVITLTTVGYGYPFPLSRAGEVFTVALLLTGIGLLLFLATEVGRSVIEGELRQALGRMRRSRMIERLSGHEIVCGWGRMGRAVVEELRRSGRLVVVVERREDKVAQLNELEIPVVAGDATGETTLRAAGVERARGLVACLNDDAHNVYTVLTARSLNASLFIIARAGEEGAEGRLQRAGANRVVNPYHHGGIRLAQLLTKPGVVDFVDFSLGGGAEAELELVMLEVPAQSPLAGRTLAEADVRRRWGVGVVAVQRGKELHPNPDASLRLAPGDVLVLLGTRSTLERFETAASAHA